MEVPNGVWVVADETYVSKENFSQYGWSFQQICKLSVGATDFADSYFIMDSDSYFIRKLDMEDYVTPDGNLKVVASRLNTKYSPGNTKLTKYINDEGLNSYETPRPPNRKQLESVREGLQLSSLEYLQNPGRTVGERATHINTTFGIQDGSPFAAVNFGPSPLFHKEILVELESCIRKAGMNWRDVIYISPWEYKWYGQFSIFAYSGGIEIIDPRCIHFATDEDVSHAIESGITTESLRKKFSSVAMASRHFERMSF